MKVRTLKDFLKRLDGCVDCKKNPAVFVAEEHTPLCKKDWKKLADSEIEWKSKEGVEYGFRCFVNFPGKKVKK